MGKQNKKERIIKVNPQKMGGRRHVAACTEELQAFFVCLSRSGASFDEKCAKERHDLTACATAAARKPKITSTINYHLQRISRLMK